MFQIILLNISSEDSVYNVEVLKTSIKHLRLKTVEIIDKALTDKNESHKFYQSDYSNACSILSEFRKVDNTKYIEVDGITIDSLNIDKVDYIWMNIEGAELKALKGAKNTLDKNDCKLLISTHKITDDYHIIDDVINILKSYGYKTNRLKNKLSWVYAEK